MIKEIGIGSTISLLIFMTFLGYNITPVILMVALLGFFYFLITKKNGSATNFKNTNISKDVSFEQIGGQATAINEFKEALDFINRADEVKNLGIRPLKGILLTGPPGTGKTLLAKAAANFTNSAFLASSGSEFVEMYAGVGAQRVRKIFQQAKTSAKSEGKNSAIIFIDEIDVLGTKRGSHASHMEYDQTLNQLLVEMDGIKASEEIKVLLVAATNRADVLDPALMRPGRFDRQVKVELPDKQGRLDILHIHATGKKMATDVQLEQVAQETFGFSGADLENLLNEAAIMAMRQQRKQINHNNIIEAIDKVMVGEKVQRKPIQEELQRIAVHETGHALVSEWIKAESVAHLTIASRGNALGYMRQNPKEDNYLYTLEMLESQIKVCLGGAVAEALIIGNKSTGSSNDFHQAVQIAKKIVYSGLSTLGVVSHEDLQPEQLNEAIQNIILNIEMETSNYLILKKMKIEEISMVLLQEESISGDELRTMISNRELAG